MVVILMGDLMMQDVAGTSNPLRSSLMVVGKFIRKVVDNVFKTRKIGGKGSAMSPVRIPGVIRNLGSVPLTVLGFGCIVAGILTVSLIGGLIMLGVLLIALEFITADE